MAREQARKLVQNCATPEERLIAIRRFRVSYLFSFVTAFVTS